MEQEGKGLRKPVLHPDEALLRRGTGNGMNCKRDNFIVEIMFILPYCSEQYCGFSQVLQD